MAVTAGKLIGWVQQTCAIWVVEIIKRTDKGQRFQVAAARRMGGGTGQFRLAEGAQRRLSKDYERLPA